MYKRVHKYYVYDGSSYSQYTVALFTLLTIVEGHFKVF